MKTELNCTGLFVSLSLVFVVLACFLAASVALANGGVPETCESPISCKTCIAPRCVKDWEDDSPTRGQCIIYHIFQGAYGHQNPNATIGQCGGVGDGCVVDGPCGLPVYPVCTTNGVGEPCGRSCGVGPGPAEPGC